MKNSILASLLACAILAGCAKSSAPETAAEPQLPTPDMSGSSGTRGGGDIDAVNFLAYGKQVGTWLESSFKSGVSAADVKSYNQMVKQLALAMDGKSSAPVIFIREDLRDINGTPKMALFSKEPILIRVHRPSWAGLAMKEKLTLSALEIFGLIGLENRYAIAAIVEENFDEITGLTGPADTPHMTISGAIIKSIHSYLQQAPPILSSTAARYYESSSEWLHGDKLFKYEAGQIDQIGKAISGFHRLPLQYIFDVFVSENATYHEVSLDLAGFSEVHLRGFEPPTEILGLSLHSYIAQTDRAIASFLENADAKLTSDEIKKLKELAQISARLMTVVDDSKTTVDASGQKTHTIVAINTPYTPFFKTAISGLRKRVQKNDCRVPSTFSLFSEFDATAFKSLLDSSTAGPDLGLIDLEVAWIKAIDSAGRFSADLDLLRDGWNQLNHDGKLDQFDLDHFAIPGSKKIGSDTATLMNISREIFNKMNKSFSLDSDSLRKMTEEFDGGKLCKK